MPCYHAALAAIALLERLNDHMLRALQREYITDTLGETSLVFSAQSRQDAEGEPKAGVESQCLFLCHRSCCCSKCTSA